MKLLIHDLSDEEQKELEKKYEGWTIISDQGTICPCSGCFSCWTKTPGECIVHDGYEKMGYLLHHAEKVQVISRYTYGGFSPFVKNVFDRSLSYVLPFFELSGNETHHKRRYDEDKTFSFLFYKESFTQEEKTGALKYVQAACRNLRGHIGSVRFEETGEAAEKRIPEETEFPGKIVLVGGSIRGMQSNSYAYGKMLDGFLKEDAEFIHLVQYLNDMPALVRKLEDADTIVFCVPLFVDGLPAQVLRLLREFEKSYQGKTKTIYVLANMGLYETEQLANLHDMMRRWCSVMGFACMGCLSIGAGELLRVLMNVSPVSDELTEKMKEFAGAVDNGERTEDLSAGPSYFPRSLYIAVANISFCLTAKKNRLKIRDLFRRL